MARLNLELAQQRESFVLAYFRDHPTATLERANMTLAAALDGGKMNIGRLIELRRQAAGQAPPPAPNLEDQIKALALKLEGLMKQAGLASVQVSTGRFDLTA